MPVGGRPVLRQHDAPLSRTPLFYDLLALGGSTVSCVASAEALALTGVANAASIGCRLFRFRQLVRK